MKLPTDLNVYQTSKCNFKCTHCRRANVGKPNASDVSLKLLMDVLRLYPIKSVCIAGFGEPLMSEFLFGNIMWLNSKGIRPGLITNGSLVAEKMDELKKVELVYLSISLNTVNEDRHKRMVGVEAFDKVINGLKEAKQQLDYPVGVSKVCFSGEDPYDIPLLLTFASKEKLDFVHLTNSIPYDRCAVPGVLTAEKDKEYLEYVEKCKEQMGFPNMKVKWPLPIKGECPCSCKSPWKSMGVNGDGWISGCNRVHPPSKEFGHYAEGGWYSRGLSELRNAVCGMPSEYTDTCKMCFGNYKKKGNGKG